MVHPLLKRLVEGAQRIAALILRLGQPNMDGENVSGIETQIGIAIAHHHTNQQPGDHQQHQREGNLRDNEAGTQTLLAVPRAGASACLEHAIWIDAGKTQCGIKRGRKTGDHGKSNRRAQHRPVDVNVRAAG